jgi:hypothetical protein
MTNAYKRFQDLIQGPPLLVGEVTAHNGDGTSTLTMPGGGILRATGTAVRMTRVLQSRLTLLIPAKLKTIRELDPGEQVSIVKDGFTLEEKNADMTAVPHLFGDIDTDKYQVVLLDPCSPLMEDLRMMNAAFGQHSDPEANVSRLLENGYLEIGDTLVGINTPPGVLPVAASWKNTG